MGVRREGTPTKPIQGGGDNQGSPGSPLRASNLNFTPRNNPAEIDATNSLPNGAVPLVAPPWRGVDLRQNPERKNYPVTSRRQIGSGRDRKSVV